MVPFSSLKKALGRDHVCSPLVPQLLQPWVATSACVEWVGRLSRETCSAFRQWSHPARILVYSALMRGKLQAGELGLHTKVIFCKAVFILPSLLDLPHPPNLVSLKSTNWKRSVIHRFVGGSPVSFLAEICCLPHGNNDCGYLLSLGSWWLGGLSKEDTPASQNE